MLLLGGTFIVVIVILPQHNLNIDVIGNDSEKRKALAPILNVIIALRNISGKGFRLFAQKVACNEYIIYPELKKLS